MGEGLCMINVKAVHSIVVLENLGMSILANYAGPYTSFMYNWSILMF